MGEETEYSYRSLKHINFSLLDWGFARASSAFRNNNNIMCMSRPSLYL